VSISGLLLALLRRLRTRLAVIGKSRYLRHGTDLHVGKGTRLWAPNELRIGSNVYIGKDVHIEANCELGDYCLLANRVAIIGRHDHDFYAVGFPVRYAPWVRSSRHPNPGANEKVVVEMDVWLGYGAVVLTGVTIGRGSIVAAGSVVTKDIPPYSIAAGVPSRVIGHRFKDASAIAMHEEGIRNGQFRLSEMGYDHCVIEPALNAEKRQK
jgi:acetyltransferase-like isoleucine patch superfamily enzyme